MVAGTDSMSGFRKSFGKQFNLSCGVLDPDYEILVRRYGKTVCTRFKEVI